MFKVFGVDIDEIWAEEDLKTIRCRKLPTRLYHAQDAEALEDLRSSPLKRPKIDAVLLPETALNRMPGMRSPGFPAEDVLPLRSPDDERGFWSAQR